MAERILAWFKKLMFKRERAQKFGYRKKIVHEHKGFEVAIQKVVVIARENDVEVTHQLSSFLKINYLEATSMDKLGQPSVYSKKCSRFAVACLWV